MQVSAPNNIKIYNLSSGKSLPEWLSERKRRKLSKNVDVRRRIELIQDFDMPGISTSIRVSKDEQYILATGIYKPRVKCFDVHNLALKFERCFDSEVITFETISNDYSKIIFLQCDRSVEFHAAHGKYYKLRVPNFGRDMKYHYPSCDVFIVGDSNKIYRINLERGQFLQPFETEATLINKCEINPLHHLLIIGTQEGKIEAWDPRVKNKVGVLDCGLQCITQNKLETVPAITALKFQGGLNLGVGTSTGHVLIYDIRSNKPLLTKDHMYGLPIKCIDFHQKMDLVYSMDSSIVKIWNKDSGKLYTSIEAQNDFNDLSVIPNSGMLLTANESVKMQVYYIPSLGPAPHWCSFLDNLTEELEELNYDIIYDDYKFVTDKELEELSLSHLKGTNLLRAYMHGYFMDIRLYRKARDVMKPFEFEEYKKKRIRDRIKEETVSRVQIQKLPSVNQELALKLIENTNVTNKKKQMCSNLLKDERFKALFNNPDFEIDKNSEEYALLNPVVSQLDKNKTKILKQQLAYNEEKEKEDKISEDKSKGNSSDESFIHDSSDNDSSDNEKQWVKEVRKNYRLIKKNEREKEQLNEDSINPISKDELKMDKIKSQVKFEDGGPQKKKQNKATFGARLENEEMHNTKISGSRGSKEMTFVIRKVDCNNKCKNDTNLSQQTHEEYTEIFVPSILTSITTTFQSTDQVDEITEDYENFISTSAVLHYCKHKILRPYLRLLGVMGLRPTNSDDSDHFLRCSILANLHTIQVTIFICIGYILQYMACFRRDRGFCYKVLTLEQNALNVNGEQMQEPSCYGNVIFNYLIPSILHLVAYLYMIYLFRVKENEQLQNLMERAFLLSSNPINRGNQKRLVHILWLFIALSIVWIIMALVIVNIQIAEKNIMFQWMENSPYQIKIMLKVFLIICTLWHDMVQGTIITSYCLQGQLLMSHLYFLRGKLLQHILLPIDWMRDIDEFKKLLKYFNDELGPAVCIYTIVNLSWAVAGIIWLFQYYINNDDTNRVTYVNVMNVALWILISIAPFIQAARLTNACSTIRAVGHEIRIRPFVYQTTPGEDLDSILLYTSSLKMCAKLFKIPIKSRYLCLLLTIGSISILTLGQCEFFS
ncbi:PREDICTED: nucleolar protein 10-like [Cyphomyrmex costatus]|uniref:nucleolar protein 10-like n=1 Tax=Cyphomyrmex costatus TaxID=456900 RepID=UPI000852304A|nr:PREDICTED: nucleolar protein 10-like [Cyphomyrmex costatus]